MLQKCSAWLIGTAFLLSACTPQAGGGPPASQAHQSAASPASLVIENPSAWIVEPQVQSRLDQPLDATTTVPRFHLDLPGDLEIHTAVRPTQKMFLCRGHSRGDGTAAVFLVSTVRKTPYQKEPLTAEQGLKVMLDSSHSARRQDWRQSEVEHGNIDGRQFVRAYWQGIEPVTHKMMRGFAYTTVDGEDLIMIGGQDFEPMAGESLKNLEAAALSFRMPKVPS